MANLLDTNQLFHFLSKSPVGLETTLDAARNKSGHTLTTDDIFGEEIPACFVPENEDQLGKIPKYSLHKNDLAAIGYGSSSVKCYYYNGTQWVKRTESWKDNELFFNRHSSHLNDGSFIQGNVDKKIEEEAVIVYRKERKGFFITPENNNTAGSGNMSVRVLKKTDTNISENEISAITAGDFVPQFLQSTDKFANGIPSIGYNPLVYNTYAKNGLVEDEKDSGAYVANSYAGIIQFNNIEIEIIKDGKNYLKNIVISVWEYVGKTLTEVLGGFASKDQGLKYGVVDSLDNVEADKKEGWIYFVNSTNPDEENVYDEFIWVDDKWEQIGSTAVTIPPPPNAGDYLKLENDTYKVKYSDTIIDDNHATVPTTTAVYNFINDQETHEEWHNTNHYKHIDIYSSGPITRVSTNKQAGVLTTGFILKLPYFSQLEELQIYGIYSKVGGYGEPAGTGNSKELVESTYAKVIDVHTNEVIGISKLAEQPYEREYETDTGAKYIAGNAVFKFIEKNQPILLGGEEYKVIFSSNDNVNDITNVVQLHMAYGDCSSNCTIFHDSKTNKTYYEGDFSPHYLDVTGNKITPPNNFSIISGMSSSSRPCRGMCVHAKFTYNRGEFNILSTHISDLYNTSAKDITDHINDSDIHFPKSLITDTYFGEEKTLDFSQGASPKGAQGIAYAQICTNHVLPENSYVSKITVPHHPSPSATEITANVPVYLVIYGDKTGQDNWEFVAHSTNKDMQVAGGQQPMVFEFKKDTDIGLYKKYRFFYVTEIPNDGSNPQLPKTGSGFNGVKMAFPSRDIDKDCHVIQTNGDKAERHTYPAIISYSSLESTLHIENEERHITKEERERWNNSATIQTGINIGTEDNPINPVARIESEGFLKGVTAINFRGAFVNVVKDDEKTITVWINKDNNFPEVSTASSSGVTTSAKYVFGSSTNAWELPSNVNNGSSFSSCHIITDDQKITLKGYKEGIEQPSVSIKNLTSKIRVEILDKGGYVTKTFITPFINENIAREIKFKSDGDITDDTKVTPACTVTFTNLKQYTTADASDGFIPNTVGFKCEIKLDTSEIVSKGGIYEARVYLDKYNDVTSSSYTSTSLHDGEIYYAYDTTSAAITGDPSVEIQKIDDEEQIETRHVSGVEYIAAGTKFEVKYKSMSNTTYMVADNATTRGKVELTGCTCTESYINGTENDLDNTVISSGSKIFTLSSNNSVQESLTATHTAYSVGRNDTKTYTYTPDMEIWASGRDDTYNTAYFEKETSSKGYGRILGHIDDAGTLVIDSTKFNSEEPLSGNTANPEYNNQAKVYNGTLVHGGTSGDKKFYVRKFRKSTSSTASQLKGFNITIPGLKMNSDKMEVWYFLADVNGLGLSKGQKISASSPSGIGELNQNDSNKVYAALNVNSLPIVPNDNEDFYIVIVLKDKDTSITGDVVIS